MIRLPPLMPWRGQRGRAAAECPVGALRTKAASSLNFFVLSPSPHHIFGVFFQE
jgi:hypothetical protein